MYFLVFKKIFDQVLSFFHEKLKIQFEVLSSLLPNSVHLYVTCQLAVFQLGLPIAVCLRIETYFATVEMKKGKTGDVERG